MMQDLDKETKKERLAGKVVEQMKTTAKFDEDLQSGSEKADQESDEEGDDMMDEEGEDMMDEEGEDMMDEEGESDDIEGDYGDESGEDDQDSDSFEDKYGEPRIVELPPSPKAGKKKH